MARNHCSEGRMPLPSTRCADLSSLSIKPPLFCVTDFLMLWNKTCQLTCVKISLVRLSNKIVVVDLTSSTERLRTTAINVHLRKHSFSTHIILLLCSSICCYSGTFSYKTFNLFLFIYLFYDNLATDGSLTCGILSCHVELSKYSTSKFPKKNINSTQNEYTALQESITFQKFVNSVKNSDWNGSRRIRHTM